MANSERKMISERRKLLGNPYAFMEQLEAYEDVLPASTTGTKAADISASRRLLENPYAHLDGEGGYDSHTSRATRAPRSGWNKKLIATEVRNLHARMWRERSAIWGSSPPGDPVTMLDPVVALRLIGFDFELEEGLGQMPGKNGPIEVAGLIDTNTKLVRVGRQFSVAERTFTAAHELGHAILHPTLGALHRDRVLDGSPIAADRVEIQANKFATLFLMPEKLVRARFREMFQADSFVPSEETSFALSSCSLSDFFRSCSSRRSLARLLAGAERYNGRHFVPLHQQFRVSREAMAIRLEELQLFPLGG